MLAGTMKRTYTIALLIFAIYFLLDVKVLSSHSWDPRAFVLERRPDIPLEQGWDTGYDAQWYYLIAADPLGAPPKLDAPNYRYQRIIYPVLIRIISLGRKDWMPWAMLATNLGATSTIAAVLAVLLYRRGVSPWFTLVVVFSLGFVLSMRFDLLEPLTIALALGGWITYNEKKPAVGILLFALSGLTKEIGLVFPIAIATWLLRQGKWRSAAWVVAGSIMPYLAWQTYLTYWLGTNADASAATRLNLVPFSGLLMMKDMPSRLLVGLWAVLPAISGGLGVAWDVNKRPSVLNYAEFYLVILQVGLMATMPNPTWLDPLAVLRTASGLLVSLLLWLAICHPRALPYLTAYYAPSIIVLAMIPGFL
jgi:hypothetical protein